METRVYRNALPARAARALALHVLGVLPAAALLAQGEDAEALADVKACVAIEPSDARLACYDGALGRAASPQDASPGAAPATAGTAGVVATTAGGTASAPPASTAPFSRPVPAPQTIVVAELRLRTPTSAVFVTSAGHVWEQADTGRGRYPETPFEARLEPGSLGSMFLISPAGGPRIRVRLRQ